MSPHPIATTASSSTLTLLQNSLLNNNQGSSLSPTNMTSSSNIYLSSLDQYMLTDINNNSHMNHHITAGNDLFINQKESDGGGCFDDSSLSVNNPLFLISSSPTALIGHIAQAVNGGGVSHSSGGLLSSAEFLGYDLFESFENIFPYGNNTNTNNVNTAAVSSHHHNHQLLNSSLNTNNFLSFGDYDDEDEENDDVSTLAVNQGSSESNNLYDEKGIKISTTTITTTTTPTTNNNNNRVKIEAKKSQLNNNNINLIENTETLIAIRDMAISARRQQQQQQPRKHKTSTSSVSSLSTIKKVAIDLQNSVQHQLQQNNQQINNLSLGDNSNNPSFAADYLDQHDFLDDLELEDWEKMLDEDCISRLTSDYFMSSNNTQINNNNAVR